VSTKSVLFDATDDNLTSSADSTLATKTYSFWAKSDDGSSAARNALFDHGDINRGAFYFRWGSQGRSLLFLGGVYRFWNETSQQSDNAWHHWLVLVSSDITATKLFCDGVEVAVNSSVTGGSTLSYTTGIRIGRGGNNFFDGSIDEFAIFDGDKTGIVNDLYNGGKPGDLTGLSGLDHWWRMGDATVPAADGTSNLLFDQANPGLGSELVTNGDYETGDFTSWTVTNTGGQTAEIATNAAGSPSAHIVSDGTFVGITQNISVTSGKAYKLSFDLQVVSGTLIARDINAAQTAYTTSGSYELITVASGSNANLEFKRSTACEFFLDNVSLKEVNGHTATLQGSANIQTDAP